MIPEIRAQSTPSAWSEHATVASTLSRLFTYAKAAGADAVENFTTEALAGAIRNDPSPLLRGLSSIGVEVTPPITEVATQVNIPGVGTLDLLVVPGERRVVAIEVKVNAGQSGNQLHRYFRWAETFAENSRPRIVVLSPQKITDDTRFPWLSWQQLWREIRRDGTSPDWLDLGRWMEEQRMADDSYEPVSESEARTLEGAHGLLRKAIRILVEPSKYMNTAWPHSDWPADEAEVKKQLVNRFGTWPSYTVQHRASRRCGSAFGIYHEALTGDAWLGIWIWAAPKRIAERGRIRDTATNLPSGWESDPTGWEFIGAYKRLTEFADYTAASGWLIERIDDLRTAGMFGILDGAGVADAGEDVGGVG
jgi:hypothetical protein